MADLNILTLSGSLRAGSWNTQLLAAAAELAPDGVQLTRYDYADVPLYNGDLDLPESVVRLQRAIAAADGVLLASPEYNSSMSGVLKNAIDWASRPAYQSCFRGKPTGVISASPGFVGGARGQQHAKVILLGMGAPVFPWPELLVGGAKAKFVDGALVDETTRGFLESYIANFAEWVGRTIP